MAFTEISKHLSQTLDTALPLLQQISEEQAARPRAAGKWSRKQIIGHLLDSASNNHQRFVRAALAGKLSFPGYDQAPLVELEAFQQLPWRELLNFWEGYNRFLAHLIAQLPQSAAQAECLIGGHAPATLEWIAGDYVEHMKHHLNQVVGERFHSAYQPG